MWSLVDRRAAVVRRVDVVHAVAVVAGGGDDQAHLDAGRGRGCCRCTAAAASGWRMCSSSIMRAFVWHRAQVNGSWSLCVRDCGLRLRQDVVRAVTVGAVGGAPVAVGDALAVDAGGPLARLGAVARVAPGRRDAGRMRQTRHVGVARDARERRVDGRPVDAIVVDEELRPRGRTVPCGVFPGHHEQRDPPGSAPRGPAARGSRDRRG